MNKRIGAFGAIVAVSALAAGLVLVFDNGDEAGANDGGARVHDSSMEMGHPAADDAVAVHKPVSPKALAFHDAMRKLWEDHVTWTRLFIVSAAADLPDTGPTADRLLQNQTDIGDAIKPFYGDAAGTQLTALLREHILIAAEILEAAKAGDSSATDAAIERWYVNGSEIATFLSEANPGNWPAPEMEAMMKEHLDLTLKEAVARLKGDYPADIAAYEEIHVAILEMADMLSDGIIAQFPGRFR